MLNKIFIMGRLTRDPELRRTQSGTPVTSFSLAVDRDFKSQSGEKETDFIDVVAWRSTAEFVAKYFTKGRMAVVEGRLQMRDWTDKDGNKRRSAEVVADNLYFGDSRRDNGGEGGSYTGGNAYSAPSAPAYSAPSGGFTPAVGGDFAEIDDEDGDLPFCSRVQEHTTNTIRRTIPWLWNVKTDPHAAASASGRRFASSAWISASILIIRMLPSCVASSASAPRSCLAAPPVPAPCISAS